MICALMVINPSSSNGPWFVKSKTCTSDTKPSKGELWGRGNDFGDVIFRVRFFCQSSLLQCFASIKLTFCLRLAVAVPGSSLTTKITSYSHRVIGFSSHAIHPMNPWNSHRRRVKALTGIREGDGGGPHRQRSNLLVTLIDPSLKLPSSSSPSSSDNSSSSSYLRY